MMLDPDLPRIISDLIKEQWDMRIGEEPVIGYKRDMYMMNSRVGAIYVYALSIVPQISTVDYRTTQRTAQLSIRITNPDRDRHIRWVNEVYRIIMANRRAGPRVLGGYEFMEVTALSPSNDLSGFYTDTMDIRMTGYAFPIESAGFGVDDMGNEIGPRSDNL